MTDEQIGQMLDLLQKVSDNLDQIGAVLERLAQPNAGGGVGQSTVHHYHHSETIPRPGAWGGLT